MLEVRHVSASLRLVAMWRWLSAGLLGSGVAAAAYAARALTRDGAVAAALVGSVTYARGGLPAAVTLLVFFASSSVLSRVGSEPKRAATHAQAKGAQRDAWQVVANGGAATLCIAAGDSAGFVGALAAAAADTWATELGLLAKTAPRSITTLRPVAAGTSGGVTPEGLLASCGGALVVGATWAVFSGGGVREPRRAVIAGVSASVIDSVLGATAQGLYRCERCDVVTEQTVHGACGERTRLQSGYAWLTNDVVNLLATTAGAILGRM